MSILLNKPSPSDAIKSSTLNLTKWATYLVTTIGGLTAVMGVAAEVSTNQDNQQAAAVVDEDPFGFNDSQRLVIIVALVASLTIVYAADLMARAVATSRIASSPVHALTNIPAASTGTEPNRVSGYVVAIRSGDSAMLFHDWDNPGNGGVWVLPQDIDFD
ncbi:hypothetical protein [Saccharothrix stipae]